MVAAAWLAANLAWLRADRLLRDGDEEGHVGAAELLVDLLRSEGPLAFAAAALAGDYGEYPPLYPALVALWWWLLDGGLPGRPAVRAVNLLWPLLSAAAVSTIAPAGRRLLPLALTLLLPGLCGLGRHFMPEGALVAAVSLFAAAAWRASRRPSWQAAALLGIAGGIALLIKQTAVLYLAGPALLAAWTLRHRAALTAGVVLAIAGPWYLTQLDAQREYAARSIDVALRGWEALAYYPLVGGWAELGPPLALLALLGAWQGRQHAAVRLGMLWGGAGLLLLIATPRKYPRLLAPLLPAAALVAGVGVRRERHGWLLAAGAAGWVGATSTVWTLPEPPLIAGVDDGCLQQWLRPPVRDDLGMGAVADAVKRTGAQQVGVIDGPQIPCALQTTHPWADHLSPYLRRAGADVVVQEGGAGRVVVDWSAEAPEVWVAPLGRGFSIRE